MTKSQIIHTDDVSAKTLGAMSVQPLLANDKIFELTKITLNGDNHTIKKVASDCAYYVLEGTGIFAIDGESQEVKTGDLIFIPMGTFYSNNGNMKLLVIDSPTLDFDKVEFRH